MLLALEGFDVLHPNYYYGLPGFACDATFDQSFSNNVSRVPFYSDFVSLPRNRKVYLQNKSLSSGYAICLGSTGFVRPRVFKKSRKVIVGFAIGGILDDIGAALGGRLTRAFTRFSHHVDVHFINTPHNYNLLPYDTTAELSVESGVSFTCRIYFLADHSISAQFITGKTVYDPLYPVAPWSGIIDCDFSDGFNYFEVCVDSEGAISSEGSAELRLNGKTVYKEENIVTSAHLAYGSDSFSEASYIRSVAISCSSREILGGSDNNMFGSNFLVDDIYIVNSEGGVNDDFLGPIKVSGQTDVSPSVSEFERIENGIVVNDPAFSPYATPFLALSQTKQLESSVLGSKEEVLREFDTIPTDEIVGVSNIIASIGNAKNPLSSQIHVIVPYIKSSAVYELPNPSICVPGVPFFAENIQNYDPSTFSRFTPGGLSSYLFGYKHELVEAQKASVSVYATKTNTIGPRVYNGNISMLTDGLFVDYYRVDLCNLFFKFASDELVAYIDIFTYTDCISVSSAYGTNYYNRGHVSGVDSGDVDVYTLLPISSVNMGLNTFRYRFVPNASIPVRGVCIRESVADVYYREIEVYRIVR